MTLTAFMVTLNAASGNIHLTRFHMTIHAVYREFAVLEFPRIHLAAERLTDPGPRESPE